MSVPCLLHTARGKPCDRHRVCPPFSHTQHFQLWEAVKEPGNPTKAGQDMVQVSLANYISTQDGRSCCHTLQRAPSRLQHPLPQYLIPLPLDLPRGIKCPSTFLPLLPVSVVYHLVFWVYLPVCYSVDVLTYNISPVDSQACLS